MNAHNHTKSLAGELIEELKKDKPDFDALLQKWGQCDYFRILGTTMFNSEVFIKSVHAEDMIKLQTALNTTKCTPEQLKQADLVSQLIDTAAKKLCVFGGKRAYMTEMYDKQAEARKYLK